MGIAGGLRRVETGAILTFSRRGRGILTPPRRTAFWPDRSLSCALQLPERRSSGTPSVDVCAAGGIAVALVCARQRPPQFPLGPTGFRIPLIRCRGAMGIAGRVGAQWRISRGAGARRKRVHSALSRRGRGVSSPPVRRVFWPDGSFSCAPLGRAAWRQFSSGAARPPARLAPSRSRPWLGPWSAPGIGGHCGAAVRKGRGERPVPQDDARSRPQGAAPSDPGKGSRRARNGPRRHPLGPLPGATLLHGRSPFWASSPQYPCSRFSDCAGETGLLIPSRQSTR